MNLSDSEIIVGATVVGIAVVLCSYAAGVISTWCYVALHDDAWRKAITDTLCEIKHSVLSPFRLLHISSSVSAPNTTLTGRRLSLPSSLATKSRSGWSRCSAGFCTND